MAFSKKFVVVLICLCKLSTITLCRPSRIYYPNWLPRICFPGDKVATVNGECTCSEDGTNMQCPTTTPEPQHQEALEEFNRLLGRFWDFMKETPNTFWEEEKEKQKKEEKLRKSIDDLRKITVINLNKEIPASKIDVPEPDTKFEEPFHPVL